VGYIETEIEYEEPSYNIVHSVSNARPHVPAMLKSTALEISYRIWIRLNTASQFTNISQKSSRVTPPTNRTRQTLSKVLFDEDPEVSDERGCCLQHHAKQIKISQT